VNLYSPDKVVLARRDASKLGAADAAENTGVAPTARLVPTLPFVTREKVATPEITASDKSTGFPFVALAAAAISHSRAASTWLGVAMLKSGAACLEDEVDEWPVLRMKADEWPVLRMKVDEQRGQALHERILLGAAAVHAEQPMGVYEGSHRSPLCSRLEF